LSLDLARKLLRQGNPQGAALALERLLAGDPGHLPAHELLTQAYLLGDRPSLAHKELLRRTLWVTGITGPRAECARADASLLFGEMPEGWDQYEARFQVPGLIVPQRHFTHPRWDGTPFPGKTLLLHYEQGLGDTLMFVRYLPLVKALGGRVLLAAQPALADLVATCPGLDGLVPKGGPVPDFDLHLPLLSLPWIFRTTLDTIPYQVPYLRVPPQVPNRAALDPLLAQAGDRLRIALTWRGSAAHPRDPERSLPPAALAPLAALPDVAWYSLQREEGPEPFPGLIPLGPLLGTFSDTAHALSAMDLLITVDTAAAHLAGALGLPALVLLTHLPDWRWLMDRTDSPWYPTLRLYRQPAPGAWDAVVQRILADLTA